jgi:hypothetical protein
MWMWWVFQILSDKYVQLVRPASGRADFVFGDQAVVHYDDSGRVGIRTGVALGEATRVYLPVGPRLAVFFTSRCLPDVGISANQVQKVNMCTWQAAVRFLGASPETDLMRSLKRNRVRRIDGSTDR